MKIKLFFYLLLFPFSQIHGQNIDTQKSEAIDAIVDKYAKAYSIVGLSIGIVNQGEQFTQHYGHTDLSKRYAVNDSTLFHVASISKLYTATAILQLVENKQLSLEDKLVDVLPNFKMKDKRHAAIKIKHLLTHSSGLRWNNNLKQSPDDHTAVSRYVQNLQKEKLKFTPGEKLSYKTYSNVGYNLLGAVVEKITGQHFDEYIHQHILRPLKMEQSTYYYEDIDPAHLAIPQIVSGDSKKIERLNLFGIDHKRKPILNGTPLKVESYAIYGEEYEHNPSGNLISSAAELNLWMQQHLAIYSTPTFDGILSASTLKETWTTQKEILNKKTSIGWGWWIHQEEELGRSVFHVGNNPGFCSILMIYPEQDFGITVLCNGWYAQEAVWHKITAEITNLYLGN